MPEIKNTTLRAEFARMAKTLNERGQNLAAEHVATAIVRTVLGELGLTEELGDDYKNERAELVKIITPCITASKN